MAMLLGDLVCKKRGASGLSYGLIVGLISIVALGAVTGVGSSVDQLMTQTADTLNGPAGTSAAGGAAYVDDGIVCTATPEVLGGETANPISIPSGCQVAVFKLWGGGGAAGDNGSGNTSTGGAGAFVTGTLVGLAPGDSLTREVGSGGSFSGNGGGASIVTLNGVDVLVAAGGGGGGGFGSGGDKGGAGGAGGDTTAGQDGEDATGAAISSYCEVASGGGGGTSFAGGAAGQASHNISQDEEEYDGQVGDSMLGGAAHRMNGSDIYGTGADRGRSGYNSYVANGGGGGGGAGYFGGGSGGGVNTYCGGGGGGGSSFIHSSVESGSAQAGDRTLPGNSGDSDRGSAGNGGAIGASGQNGTIIVTWQD